MLNITNQMVKNPLPGQRCTVRIGGLEVAFRWIPPGRFWMGSPEGEVGRWGDEGPQHEVSIARGFWMGEVPVTQALYEAVMGYNPSYFVDDACRPVEMVSWSDAVTFCARAGADLRLPTEAEWEYACRAGTVGSSYAPGVPVEELGWYAVNSPDSTQPVGQKLANAWGLYDMLGNVLEWCGDCYVPYAAHARTDTPELRTGTPGLCTDPSVPRVFRGGSWVDGALWLRPASRISVEPSYSRSYLGFRVVCDSPTSERSKEERP